MKTKRKRKGKKKRTLEGDPSHRKTEGEIFQTKSDPDGGEGSGERRKGRTAGGGVLPELKKLENRPFKKKKKKRPRPFRGPGGRCPLPTPAARRETTTSRRSPRRRRHRLQLQPSGPPASPLYIVSQRAARAAAAERPVIFHRLTVTDLLPPRLNLFLSIIPFLLLL